MALIVKYFSNILSQIVKDSDYSIYNMRVFRNKFSAKYFLCDVAIRRLAGRITLNAQMFQEKWLFLDALQLDKYEYVTRNTCIFAVNVFIV